MAHRLIASTRSVDSVLKNGLLTGNFNNLAQVQPRYSDIRRFLSQSKVCFSYEPPKFDKPVSPKEGSNSGRNDRTGGDRKKKSRPHVFHKNGFPMSWYYVTLIGSSCLVGFANWRKWESSFKPNDWKDVIDHKVDSRVKRVEVKKSKTSRFQLIPVPSMEFTETLEVAVENFESAENEAKGTENLDTKVEHKTEAPVAHKENGRK